MKQQPRLLQTLRKEFAYQCSRNWSVVRVYGGVLVVISICSGLGLWHTQRLSLHRQAERQLRTDEGILKLRVHEAGTTVLDWGHYDSIYRYASGEDPGFVERELSPASIVSDGQRLIVVDASGRWLTQQPPQVMSLALADCIQQRLRRLQQLSAQAPSHRSFGLFCRAGGQAVIGAGTGIRPSSGALPERGWLLHLSTVQRPSYGSALNDEFRRISDQMEVAPRSLAAHHLHLASFSELEQPGDGWVLQSPQSSWQLGVLAARNVLPAWLALNGGLLSLGPVALLIARQRRLSRQLRTVQDRRAQRRLQLELGQLLLSRRQLLLTLDQQAQHERYLLGAVRLVERDASSEGQAPADQRKTQLLQTLIRSLAASLQPSAMGRMRENTVVFSLPAGDGDPDPAVRQRQLTEVLTQIRHAADPTVLEGFAATLVPQCIVGASQQALLLDGVVQGEAPRESVQWLEQVPAESAGVSPVGEGSGAGAEYWMESVDEGCYLESPVLELSGGAVRTHHTNLCFSLEKAAGDPERLSTVARWFKVAPGDRLIDRYMLGQARAWLQARPSSGDSVAVRLSPATLLSEGSITALLQALEPWPPEKLQRLLIGLEEETLTQLQSVRRPELEALQHLGVRLAIEAFGRGAAPIQSVFALSPSVLRLDAEIGQRVQDKNALSMVKVLLTLSRYKRCTVVVSGIDREDLLRTWLRMGVIAFEGSAVTAQSLQRQTSVVKSAAGAESG